MASPPPTPELLHALGRLVRGLTAIFWGLPAALLVGVHTGLKTRLDLRLFDAFLPPAATGLLLYGVWMLAAFHPQETIWMRAVDRSRALALVLTGFSPFLYWHVLLPEVPAYSACVWFLAVFGVLFLFHFNHLLQRLVAMLPAEALRQETMTFTRLNQVILAGLPLAVVLSHALPQLLAGTDSAARLARAWQQFGPAQEWLFLLFTLLPVATTMAMVWKIKEAVLHSLFSAPR
ncbi:MAG: hypothetical protein N3J91_15160 [Verrucomicrobiae bacterium]|nr:hypothetical protein [Verrucomicrobiae bacterium]